MKFLKKIDAALLMIIVALFLMALLSLYSASHQPDGSIAKNFAMRQSVWMLFSLCLLAVVVWLGYEFWLDYAYVIFAVNILLLLLVLAVGNVALGAKRWLNIGLFTLQPSELCKVSFILALVKYLSDNKDKMNTPGPIITSFIICILPMALIIKQPDLGTAIVFLPALFFVLLAAGARLRYVLGFAFLGALSSPIFWHFLKDYQRKRLLVFLNPNFDPLGTGYTVIQSKIAVGSGGFFGKGWLSGTQNQLNFLPERHTDFVFSVIGEEWGFIGALLVIGLFMFLIRRLLNIASETNDERGRVLVVGVAAVIWFQVFVNIAMTVGLLPVVGLPLPLFSYGGSNLTTTVILIGLAMSVKFRRKIF